MNTTTISAAAIAAPSQAMAVSLNKDQITKNSGTKFKLNPVVPADLDLGTPQHLHVHCAAPGLNLAPAIPIFTPDRVTPQPVRTGLIPFNAALVGFVEATRSDVAQQNRLCPTNRLPDTALDWLRGTLISMRADYLWTKEADIGDWLERARLNPSRGLRDRFGDPRVQQAFQRFVENVRPGLENLKQLLAQASG